MNRKNLVVILLIGFAVLLSLYNLILTKKKDEKLEIGNEVYGIIISIDSAPVHGSPSSKIEYKVENVKYILVEDGNFFSMDVGDTVLVKYSIEDHSVARVTDKYYMKKYKDLKNK